jgi:hypothetical protein
VLRVTVFDGREHFRAGLRVRVPADELARQRALTQSIMAGMD